MSDATLPPRSSSADPVDEGNGQDSSLLEQYPEAEAEETYMSAVKEDGSGDSGGGMDNKQKRKRTRFVDIPLLCAFVAHDFWWNMRLEEDKMARPSLEQLLTSYL